MAARFAADRPDAAPGAARGRFEPEYVFVWLRARPQFGGRGRRESCEIDARVWSVNE